MGLKDASAEPAHIGLLCSEEDRGEQVNHNADGQCHGQVMVRVLLEHEDSSNPGLGRLEIRG